MYSFFEFSKPLQSQQLFWTLFSYLAAKPNNLTDFSGGLHAIWKYNLQVVMTRTLPYPLLWLRLCSTIWLPNSTLEFGMSMLAIAMSKIETKRGSRVPYLRSWSILHPVPLASDTWSSWTRQLHISVLPSQSHWRSQNHLQERLPPKSLQNARDLLAARANTMSILEVITLQSSWLWS